ENQKKSAKTSEKIIVGLYKSDSSLGAISKCLKIPRSSVQTIVGRYKHYGTTQPSYRSGWRRVLSPRDERTLMRKVQINTRTTAKDLVKMQEEKVAFPKGYLIATILQFLPLPLDVTSLWNLVEVNHLCNEEEAHPGTTLHC
uniref:Sleeping Beauty transposase HTH domain-containing protein n=1 Tax=Oncorhynchus tshawytscha TaxID=74940 RepID=A0AAZ3Q218_ONCTS